jgi:fructoselysine-6-P-deglycase FrlB-like protein
MSDSVLESAEMSEIAREIASQPVSWQEAMRRADELGDVLPPTGTRVVAIGCGTSFFVARSYARLREDGGRGETDAFAASEIPDARSYERSVVISRSGTTTEVERFLASARPFPAVAIVADPDTPIAGAAEAVVSLPFADERSVVQTRFATSVLAMLRAHVGDDVRPAVEQAEAALTQPLPIEPEDFSHYVFLGQGWGVGLAEEGALKLRETAQAWTEAYPAMEYRHGPISVAGPGTVVWAVGAVDASVLEDAAVTGATIVGGELDPMAELVRIQRTGVALAEHRGLDPDRPRHLTRSVVLSGDPDWRGP